MITDSIKHAQKLQRMITYIYSDQLSSQAMEFIYRCSNGVVLENILKFLDSKDISILQKTLLMNYENGKMEYINRANEKNHINEAELAKQNNRNVESLFSTINNARIGD